MKRSAINLPHADRINGGAWITAKVQGNDGEIHDFSIRTRGLQSIVYRRVQAEVLSSIPAEKIGDADVLYAADAECIARGLWLDWQLQEDDGTPVPFTAEAALELLSHPGAVNLHPAAFTAAYNVAKDGLESLDAALKN